MIHYHGTPLTPDDAAIRALTKRHALVSFAYPQQESLVASVCRSFILDNGAFSSWRTGTPITDWTGYYEWAERYLYHPRCDFALIPDVIDGTEYQNDLLIAQWPFRIGTGVPIWHMHESLERLDRLVTSWPRVALGSSGTYAVVGTNQWWERIAEAMTVACDVQGRPRTKLHGLRMLNPRVFTRLPLTSADSSNVARNIGIDKAWSGTYLPPNKGTRAVVLADRIESHLAADRWEVAECTT